MTKSERKEARCNERKQIMTGKWENQKERINERKNNTKN
jgi:hypothetical protein